MGMRIIVEPVGLAKLLNDMQGNLGGSYPLELWPITGESKQVRFAVQLTRRNMKRLLRIASVDEMIARYGKRY